MAGKEYPLSIVIRTIDEATADLRKITGTMSKLGSEVERAGKALTAALTLPIVGIGAASVKAFADFEKGMANVSTLIDTNTESLAEIITGCTKPLRGSGVTRRNQPVTAACLFCCFLPF